MSTTYILVAGDAQIADLVAAAAGEITAVVVGERAVAEAVAAAGVNAVTWLGDPGDMALESYASSVADLVAAASPDVVLAATRAADRVLAGAVAARLKAPAYTQVIESDTAEGTTIVRREIYGGIATETVAVQGPVVLVLDGGPLVSATAPGSGDRAPITEATPASVAPIQITENRPAERASVNLGRAARIVSAGRGVKSAEDLSLIEALATKLDAEVACSRPLAEGAGWFSHDRYVGVTGQHVAPALYVAVGISGQLQHVVGAREADTIVVINSDKDCPYFTEADYCVVGDLYQVVPALTEALA